MPIPLWSLSLAQIIFYTPSVIPLLYVLYRHRNKGILGWFFLVAFLGLQIVASGLVLSAGQNGIPSTTAIIILEVGLSALLLSLAGVVAEWIHLATALSSSRKKLLVVAESVYHIGVATGIALYAVGASNVGEGEASGAGIEKTGVAILLVLWLALCAAHGILGCTLGARRCSPLFLAIAISLALVGIRILFRVVATFAPKQEYNLLGGKIVYAVVLEFLPALAMVVALVTAGVMTVDWLSESRVNDLEMAGSGSRKG